METLCNGITYATINTFRNFTQIFNFFYLIISNVPNSAIWYSVRLCLYFAEVDQFCFQFVSHQIINEFQSLFDKIYKTLFIMLYAPHFF